MTRLIARLTGIARGLPAMLTGGSIGGSGDSDGQHPLWWLNNHDWS